MQKTFGIIKPDAVKDRVIGNVISMIEQNGFEIIELKRVMMNKVEAQEFYSVHKERPFFAELVDYMISGPVVLMVLQKHNAIQEWRDLMGATDPQKAAEGTIRRMYGKSIGSNVTHGSDAPETALIEIEQFFPSNH